MREHIRKIAAGAGIALGVTHLLYGLIASKALTPEYVWFAGAGIAMIVVGVSGWRAPVRSESIVMIIYMGIMASLIPLPQVFLGLAIFLILALTSLVKRKV